MRLPARKALGCCVSIQPEGRGFEARPREDGRLERRAEPVAQPATSHLEREVGRFLFWIKGKEVRSDEKAHYAVDRGAHDGSDDVRLWGGVR
jgi:hypothetical protein